MRIAYVNYGSQSGVTANILRGLVARGHQVESVDPTSALSLRDPGTRLPRPTPSVLLHLAASVVQHGPRAMERRWNTPFAFDAHSKKAGELLAALETPPDIVLQNGALFAPGKPAKFPYVLLLDNTCRLQQRQPPGLERELGRPVDFGSGWFERERATYLGARAIATFSEVVRQSLIDDYGVPGDRVHVVGAGANIAPLAELAARKHDGRSLLFVGKGIFEQKGGNVLLRAFARLHGVRSSLKLTLIGPNEPLPEVNGVENLGLRPLDEVAQRMREATAFVLPTLREPFGIAFLDAMGQGVPCIGSHIGAVPEILDQGRAGMLVPPGDDGALAKAIGALLDDPDRAARLSQAGHARVVDGGYQWPEVARRLELVLTGNVGRRTAA